MFARRFFYVSLAILALSVAYHLGARNATAQGSGTVDHVFPTNSSRFAAMSASGDVWYSNPQFNPSNPDDYPWTFGGNIFAGAPTPTKSTSWGSVKGKEGK